MDIPEKTSDLPPRLPITTYSALYVINFVQQVISLPPQNKYSLFVKHEDTLCYPDAEAQ